MGGRGKNGREEESEEGGTKTHGWGPGNDLDAET
jgi:hypothetical protein